MEMFAEGSDLDIRLRYRDETEDPAVVARNRQTIMHALDAVVAGNIETFWSIFDPDVVFHEASCLPYGGAHRGLEATKSAFASLSHVFSKNHVIFEQVLAAGNIVIAYQTIDFRIRANGSTGSIPVAELFRFQNGKVIEWRALYFDSALVAGLIRGSD